MSTVKIEGMEGEFTKCELKPKWKVYWRPSWKGTKNKFVRNTCNVCGGAAKKGVKRHPKCRSHRKDGVKRVLPRSKIMRAW